MRRKATAKELTWCGRTLSEVVRRAKNEVCNDIFKGFVPETVASASELHDHVDANYYGGAFEEWNKLEMDNDDFCRFWNAVHDELDRWIKAGRPVPIT